MSQGDGIRDPGIQCPKCGASIVYNGNYFCSRWGDCDWAMGEQNSPFNRKIIRAYLTQRIEQELAKPELDTEELERLTGYLEDVPE